MYICIYIHQRTYTSKTQTFHTLTCVHTNPHAHTHICKHPNTPTYWYIFFCLQEINKIGLGGLNELMLDGADVEICWALQLLASLRQVPRCVCNWGINKKKNKNQIKKYSTLRGKQLVASLGVCIWERERESVWEREQKRVWESGRAREREREREREEERDVRIYVYTNIHSNTYTPRHLAEKR